MDPPDGTPLGPRAPRSPPAGVNSTQAAADHPSDSKHIDTQYANQKAKKDLKAYGKEPWRFMDGISYQGDIANAYLSIRIDKRDEFLKNLDKDGREKVEHEKERIKETRERFETYEDKKAMFKALKKARMAWRCDVVKTLPARRKVVGEYAAPERQAWSQADGAASPGQAGQGAPSGGGRDPEPPGSDRGFKASAMYFQLRQGSDGVSWEGCDSNHSWFGDSKFPDQKIAAHKLLEKHEDNPLTKREDNRLRWFHFPANNMHWIEQAMARYYGENDVVLDKLVKPHSEMTQAERLLCREFWRGQLHGSGEKAPIHARHMRSRFFLTPRESPAATEACTEDSKGKKPLAPPPNHTTPGTRRKAMKNMGLFVPYLHWETNGRRAGMIDAINNADNIPEAKKKGNTGKPKPDFMAVVRGGAGKPESWPAKPSKDGACSKNPRKPTRLGEYLMQLARVANAMESEMDEQLLKENLHKEPPLHIRRTLDQYYFLTLDDTSERDRDQVVYRATLHSPSTRVVMVDQLWLWVLDDDTIITSFPRRWGRNKPDPSGVHKCLRDRLANSRSISSIYHLALIIIDQCSGVFFDRTKPLDQRPEVIDIFGSAIGNITDLTVIAHETFWRNTSLHSRNILPSDAGAASPLGQYQGSKNTSQRYLDINPEGTLLREGRDIAEELKIMHRVFHQQRQAVKDFRRHLGQLVSGDRRHGRGSGEQTVQSLVRSLADLVREETDARSRTQTRPTLPKAPTNSTIATDSSSLSSPLAAAGRRSSTSTWRDEASSSSASMFGDGNGDGATGAVGSSLNDTLQEADMLLESIESRQAEIQDLEDSALRTCQQLESLLTLKQQQASIVEAKAALDRASESVKQGRAIVAFTIVTIFFLPLGFFAAIFGMNNATSAQDDWMTLNDQIGYMFGLSSVVIIIAVSIAFSSWVRALLTYLIHVPILLLAEVTKLRALWDHHVVDEAELEKRNNASFNGVSKRRREERVKKMEERAKKTGEKEKKKREREKKKKGTAAAGQQGQQRNETDECEEQQSSTDECEESLPPPPTATNPNGSTTAGGGPAASNGGAGNGRRSERGPSSWLLPFRRKNRSNTSKV